MATVRQLQRIASKTIERYAHAEVIRSWCVRVCAWAATVFVWFGMVKASWRRYNHHHHGNDHCQQFDTMRLSLHVRLNDQNWYRPRQQRTMHKAKPQQSNEIGEHRWYFIIANDNFALFAFEGLTRFDGESYFISPSHTRSSQPQQKQQQQFALSSSFTHELPLYVSSAIAAIATLPIYTSLYAAQQQQQ